jgi:two-component system chemotaxis response regulator CheY
MNGTVLVVDDSPTVVKFVAFSLKSSGLKVVAASDGMDAMERISSLDKSVDLVITDLNMPNMDGYELISALRQSEEYSGTPIIILTSEEDDADKALGAEVGADSYLTKPFKSSVLIDEVGKYLDESTVASNKSAGGKSGRS